MNLIDSVYFLPGAIVIGVLIAYLRMMKKPKTFKNLFRNGEGIPLEKTIVIQSFISREDFVKANRQLSPGVLSKNRFYSLFYVVLFVVIYSSTISFNPFSYISIIGPVIFIGGFFIVSYFTNGVIMRRSANTIYDSTEFVKNDMEYTFNATGYECASKIVSGKGSWQIVQGYAVTSDFVVVYTSTIVALFLSKSSFTPQDLEVFTNFLQQNFENRKR